MYLFSELFAQSDQKKNYVYLSDGGHFENLAVYELLRRRCRLIIAGDGDADGDYGFSDLLSLIEKARTDFGVRIEIDFASIRPACGSRECPKNFAIGKIYYDPENRNDVGTLSVHPGERKLCRRAALRLREFSKFSNQIQVLLKILSLKPRGSAPVIIWREIFESLELASKKSASQRTIGNEADAQFAAGSKNFVLRIASPQ